MVLYETNNKAFFLKRCVSGFSCRVFQKRKISSADTLKPVTLPLATSFNFVNQVQHYQEFPRKFSTNQFVGRILYYATSCKYELTSRKPG